MPTPEQADAISRLSAFALFVLIVLFIGVGLWKKWWVPGWLWDQERAARLIAETQATRNADALATMNAAFVAYVKEGAAVRRELRALRDELGRRA